MGARLATRTGLIAGFREGNERNKEIRENSTADHSQIFEKPSGALRIDHVHDLSTSYPRGRPQRATPWSKHQAFTRLSEDVRDPVALLESPSFTDFVLRCHASCNSWSKGHRCPSTLI